MATSRPWRGMPLTRLGIGAAQFGNLNRTRPTRRPRAADAAWDTGARYVDTAAPLRPRIVGAQAGRRAQGSPTGRVRPVDEGGQAPGAEPAGRRPRRRCRLSGPGRPSTRLGLLARRRPAIARAEPRRLGTARIDVVYLRDPDDHWVQASTTGIDTLIELRDEGVISAVGAGMNQSALWAELVRRCDVDIVMVAGRCTLMDQSAAHDLLSAAHERRVRVVAAGIYALCEFHGVTLPDAAVQFPCRHQCRVGRRRNSHRGPRPEPPHPIDGPRAR